MQIVSIIRRNFYAIYKYGDMNLQVEVSSTNIIETSFSILFSVQFCFLICTFSNEDKHVNLQVFDAQVVILEHKSIICAGYSAVMHIHCAAEEITVKVNY